MKHRIAALALVTVPLLAAASRPPLPDLTPAVVVAGNPHSITMRIRNQGTAPSPAGLLNVSLGAPISANKNYAMPAIPAGRVASVTVQIVQPLPGVHYVVRLDVNHAIPESNENNNVASGTFP